MPVYPKKVADILGRREDVDDLEANASGRAASFACGCYVAFDLEISDGICRNGRMRSNGCGFMAASAKTLIDKLNGASLHDLNGLSDIELIREIETEVGLLDGRRHCAEICVAALHKTFETYRAKVVAEFAGETALICACFGIGEDTIEKAIKENSFTTVEQVSRACMAGRGCGSCQPLIQEIIDSVGAERL